MGEKCIDGNHFMPLDSLISVGGCCRVGRGYLRRRRAGMSGSSVTNRICDLKYKSYAYKLCSKEKQRRLKSEIEGKGQELKRPAQVSYITREYT